MDTDLNMARQDIIMALDYIRPGYLEDRHEAAMISLTIRCLETATERLRRRISRLESRENGYRFRHFACVFNFIDLQWRRCA